MIEFIREREVRVAHGVAPALGVAVLVCAAGCQETAPPPGDGADTAAVARIGENEPPLYTLSDCGQASDPAPAPGSGFDYAVMTGGRLLADGPIRREVIVRRDGDTVHYGETITAPGMPPTPSEPRAVRHGFLPISGPGVSLGFLPSARTVAELAPGEALRLQATETTQGPDGETSRPIHVKVTFLGCGTTTPLISGVAAENVKIYRTLIPTPRLPNGVTGEQSVEIETLVSTRSGWRVAERTASATSILVREG